MFTAEIRINGTLISHIYGRNTSHRNTDPATYTYELYRTESSQIVTGDVKHRQKNGIEALIVKILTDAIIKSDD